MEENKELQEQKEIEPAVKENTKTKTDKKKVDFNSILSFVAYIGIGCIAISLILTLILDGDVKLSSAFRSIGEVIAYIICIILAFSWVKNHKKIPWIVCYVVFVVTIVVLFILTI